MKRYLSFTALLLTAVFLFSPLFSYALTTGEKEIIYNTAVEQLETYLEDQQENIDQLTDIYESFKSLKGYEKSAGFASYVHVLMLIADERYDSFELDFELNENLKSNAVFIRYLEDEMKDSAICTLADLENYVKGRTAEAQNDELAIEYFRDCIHYFDSEERFSRLHNVGAASHYELAMIYFNDGNLEEAYKEFQLAGKYEDSEARIRYILKKLGYSPEHEHVWNDATCVLPKTCSECGMTEGEPMGHSWNEGTVVKEASCIENGEMLYTCTVCGETEKKVIDASGEHVWDDGKVTVQGTCTENEKKVFTCTVCGTEKTEIIYATGEHVWDAGVVTNSQTCTASGMTVYTCVICGEQRNEEIAKTGEHKWDKGTVTKKVTCTEDGIREFTCTVCGQTSKETIKATGEHNWNSGKVTKEATCAEDGIREYTCKVCGKTRKETIKATEEHNWDSGKVTKEATCTESGKRKYTCKVCGQTRSETIKATGNHTWDNGKVTKEATCGAEGIKTYTCSVCGSTRTESVSATGNHSWDSGKVTKAATDTSTGVKTYTCQGCGKTKTETIAVIVPTYSDWVDTLPSGKTASDTKTQYRSRNITTQYRYRDLITQSSKDTQLGSEWTLVSTEKYYGSWSSYSTTAVTASSTLEVESKNENRVKQVTYWEYSRWGYENANDPGKVYYTCVNYQNQNPAAVKKVYGWKYTESTTRFTNKGKIGGCTTYVNASGAKWYNEKQTTKDVTETVKVYRSRKIGTQYNYQRWGDWSSWSANSVSQSSTRQVETQKVTDSWTGWSDRKITQSDTVEVQTRTLYRYRTN